MKELDKGKADHFVGIGVTSEALIKYVQKRHPRYERCCRYWENGSRESCFLVLWKASHVFVTYSFLSPNVEVVHSSNKGLKAQLKIWKDRYSKIPGRGGGGNSLGISGWGCAVRTLEPLA